MNNFSNFAKLFYNIIWGWHGFDSKDNGTVSMPSQGTSLVKLGTNILNGENTFALAA